MLTHAVQMLTDADRWRLRFHYHALNAEDRRLRFGAALNEHALDRYVDLIDFDTEAVFAIPGEGHELSAVVHVAPVGEGAELGLSVLPGRRGRGMGSCLFAQAAAWARNRYIGRIFMHCLRENAAILHIARKQGMSVSSLGTESSAVLCLPAPDITSWMDEQRLHWQGMAEEMMRVETGLLDWLWSGPRGLARALIR
jgi:GNAT superfamily N-acetyltransferase